MRRRESELLVLVRDARGVREATGDAGVGVGGAGEVEGGASGGVGGDAASGDPVGGVQLSTRVSWFRVK